MSEIGRIPARVRRCCIQRGDGFVGSTPRTSTVTKRVQPARSRIGARSSSWTGTPAVPAAGVIAETGSVNGCPVAWAYSRATPRIENA